MPSSFSTEHSLTDAIDLAENLGCRYDIIPITSSFDRHAGNTEALVQGPAL